MENAAGVGVVEGVADVQESPQQLAQSQRTPAGVTGRVSRVFETHR
jgi:hypothetical protein